MNITTYSTEGEVSSLTNEIDAWLKEHPHTDVELVLAFRPLAGDMFVNPDQVRRFARRLRRRLPGLDKAKVEDVREYAWFGKPAYHDTMARFVVREPARFAPHLSDQDIQVALLSKRVNLHRISLFVGSGSYGRPCEPVSFYRSADDDSLERYEQDCAFVERQEKLLRQWWEKYAEPMY